MNKKIILVIIILTIISIAGCSNEKVVENAENLKDNTQQEAIINDEEQQQETESESGTKNEEMSGKMSVDKSLQGAELLASIKYNPPKNMIIESKLTGSGMSSTATTYHSGENSRTETLADGLGKQIVIYNAKEGITYQYTEGESQGIKLKDGEDSEDSEMSVGMMELDFSDLVDASSEDITARMEKLDGEDVVYIEATESDEDMGDVDVLMWYSVRYSVPLKYEMQMNGQVMMSSVVTNIEADAKIKDDIFVPPKDIEFMEYNMDSLFEQPIGD